MPVGILSLFPAFVFRERFVRRVGRLGGPRGAAACAKIALSEWDDPVVIVCRLGPLSCHVRFRFDRGFLAPLSAPARDFKQNRNHIRDKALRLGSSFCPAVCSPGEEKNSSY